MIWYNINNKKPIATEGGNWCGLRSDKILIATKTGNYHVARMYEGFLDGSTFCEFYDESDFEISNVLYWTEIDSPFNLPPQYPAAQECDASKAS